MPTKCCIKNCKRQNGSPVCPQLNFFKVPKDAEKRKKWQTSVNRYCETKIELRENLRICGLHFNKECFAVRALGQRIRLKYNAVPTIFKDYNECSVIEQDPDEIQLEDFSEDISYNGELSNVNSLHNFTNYHNFSTHYLSKTKNHNPAPEQWLQKLQQLEAVSVSRSKNYKKNISLKEAEVLGNCEVLGGSEDIVDDNIMPVKIGMRSNNSLSPDNIIQITENDFTTNTATGDLTFQIDPEALPSNKYQLPDGRIVTIKADSKKSGGYSASVGGVANAGTTPKMPLKLRTNVAILRSGRGSRIKNTRQKTTPKIRSNISIEPDLEKSVHWYRYNLIDAMESLQNSLGSLSKLKQEATTEYLETRTDNDIRKLNKSLDRLLGTTAEKFSEIRENLNEELRQYIEKKQGSFTTDDDDEEVLILPRTGDNDDPIFIDENSLEFNDDYEVDLTGNRRNKGVKTVDRSFTPTLIDNNVIAVINDNML